MSWHRNRMCAFDLESTGVNVDTALIVTGAVIGVGGGPDIDSRTWLSDLDGAAIPAEATAIHHITTEHAHTKGAPAAAVIDEIAAALTDFLTLGVPIVGHNVVYDISLLDRECRRHQIPTLSDRFVDDAIWPVLDTRVLDQYVLPFRRRVSATQGARQLITLAQVYGFPWDEAAAHGSEYDALMAARIAFRINQIAETPKADRPDAVRDARQELFDHITGLDLHALHAAQIVWAADQAAGLQRFFRKTDPKAFVDPHWPLIPFVTAEEATV